MTAPAEWPLSPRAARVLYNAADAWGVSHPQGPDPVAALAPRLADPGERARLERALAWLEWSPRLLLHSACGFSWLPRGARRAWLERLERGGPFRGVARRVRVALGVPPDAGAPADAGGDQSFEGA